MKTISQLTAGTAVVSTVTPTVLPSDIHNVQGQKPFWRRQRMSKNGLYHESSTGGSVFIPMSELWALAENHDANLKMPPKTS